MRMETERLGTEAVTPLLLRLALPSMAGVLIANLYVIVDRMFVGNFVGENGLAAMNAAAPLSMIIFAVAILIGRGSGVLYSIALGRKDYAEAQRLFGLSMLLYCVISGVITAGGLLYLDALLRFFGVPEATLPYGRSYLSVSLAGTLPWMIGFHNNLIRAEGYSTLAMCTQILGAGANVLLDWFFVAGLGWGMAGAAWATVIAQTLSALWVLNFFLRGKSVVRFDLRSFRLYSLRLLGLTLYNGCSPFAINISASLIWTVQNRMIREHGGVLAMAAFGVIPTVGQFLLTPLFGISMGMQPLVGYNIGARNFRRVIEIFRQSVKLAALIAVAPYLLVMFFPETVMRWFADDAAVDLIRLGGYSMRHYLLLMPLGCGSILVSQYFQGVGKAPVALMIALLRQILFQLPLTFILPLYFSYDGVLVSGPVGDALAFFFSLWIMRRELKRLKHLALREEYPVPAGHVSVIEG